MPTSAEHFKGGDYMSIKLSGEMTGTQLKQQLDKAATKDTGKCMCTGLKTSFFNVGNPLCTANSMNDQFIRPWASLLIESLFCWNGDPCTNKIVDAFKHCNKRVGNTLYTFAQLLQNDFAVFPLAHLKTCDTWDSIFASSGAVDDICSFYPLFSLVGYMFGERLANAAIQFGSKIYCIKDGYAWTGEHIGGILAKNCLCGAYQPYGEYVEGDDAIESGWYDYTSYARLLHENGGLRIISYYSYDYYLVFSGFYHPKRSGDPASTEESPCMYFDTSFITDVVQNYAKIFLNADASIPNSSGYFYLFSDAESPDSVTWIDEGGYSCAVSYTNGNASLVFAHTTHTGTVSVEGEIMQVRHVRDGDCDHIKAIEFAPNYPVLFKNLYFTLGSKS